MVISCPLCCSPQFSDPGHLLASLSALLRSPLQCPVPYCGTPCHGLEGLIQHLPCHLQPPELLPPPPDPVQESDNIEQVIKDLEELVDRETNGNVGVTTPWPVYNDNNVYSAPMSPVLPPPAPPPPYQYHDNSSVRSPGNSSHSSYKVSSIHHSKPVPYTKPPAARSSGPSTVTSSGSGGVTCGECGWMFDNASFLHLHKALMHGRRRPESTSCQELTTFVCDQCDHGLGAPGHHHPAAFTSIVQYSQHLQTQHNDNRHVCKYCAKLFKLKGSLLVHQRVMHQPPSAKEDVTKVKEEVGGDGDIELPPDSGNSQIVENDPKLEEMTGGSSVSCHSNVLLDNNNMVAPVSDPPSSTKTTQDKDSKQWDCSFCGKKFTTKYFLKKHIRLHTGETPYSCNICNKTFSFQQSYHKHMLYHTDEKPHSCSVCGRSFKELSTLQNHERIHSGERPFVCETCGKSFRQRVSYLVHRRIHTGVLPYSCDHCDRKFRYKVTQRTHKCTGMVSGAPVSSGAGLTMSPGNTMLSEESANGHHNISDSTNVSIINNVPPLSQEIKQNLVKLRKAQGRRQFSSRIQNILSKTHNKKAGINQSMSLPPTQSQQQPISELQRLCLDDVGASWSTPNIEQGQNSNDQSSEQVTIHNGEMSAKVSEEQLMDINNTIIDFADL